MADMDDKQALVLGSHGRLGHILYCFARDEGLAWQWQARRPPANLVWSGAFSDPALAQALAGGVQTLVNLIGVTPTTGNPELMEDTNLRFVTDLLRVASDAGVPHVVLASTAAVYGPALSGPLRETDRLSPTTDYGRSKARMEEAARNWVAKNGGPAVSILRIGNVAGADVLLQSARDHAGKRPMPLHIAPDGAAIIRPYIGPLDFFRAMRATVNRRAPAGQAEVFNLAHPAPVSLNSLVAAYRDTLLPDLTWNIEQAPEGTRAKVVFATAKLESLITLTTAPDQAAQTARQVALFETLSKEATF